MGRRSRSSREAQLRQLAALPPDVILRQGRLTHLFLLGAATLTLAALVAIVQVAQGGRGVLAVEGGAFHPAPLVAGLGVALALGGWFFARPWRALLRGDRLPTDRLDFARTFQRGFAGLFLAEGGTVVGAVSYLLGGHPGELAAALVAYGLLAFQRIDRDRATELVRHLEGSGDA